ncbi:hypothetical protein [Parapedobacter sp. 10938]|uniref:hypothetical protein n=1 Tax=Parapedobacter flavus TaxID=3110225 RepID=UPI002DB55D4E|nr:hypothetical protein [Parapedobacter sp. 10938]MEC3880088.1 hypothetical protein [Parapedobacter sp. 10938]
MKRLLALFTIRPYLLDLLIALIFLPIFCHLVVALRSKRGIDELVFMRGYLIPMAISYCCGLAVMAYIRWNNHQLNKRYGIDDGWELRAVHQLQWNILPPILFVIVVIAIYFASYGENLVDRGYLEREFFWVLMGIVLLVLLYYVQNKHLYFWKRQAEEDEYQRLGGRGARQETRAEAPMANPADTKETISVTTRDSAGEAIDLPIAEVAVIDRHNGETRVSTWDGGLFMWSIPALKMKAFAESKGFKWLGQHYGLCADSVVDSEGVGEKGRKLLLKSGIAVVPEKQVMTGMVNEERRTFLLFHKNIAKEVGQWFDQRHEKGHLRAE